MGKRKRERESESEMKVKHLESILQGVEQFRDPKVDLEQYPTPPHLAAHIALHLKEFLTEAKPALHLKEFLTEAKPGPGHDAIDETDTTAEAASEQEESGKEVVAADLGCGTGILSIALVVAGVADKVYAFDSDPEALRVARKNIVNFELEEDILLFQTDLSSFIKDEERSEMSTEEHKIPLPYVDLVLMNPPFGTRRAGIDMAFVKLALHMTHGNVFSLHKTSTREYLLKQTSTLNADVEVVAQLRYNIPRMYHFHSSDSSDIEVDLLRFRRNNEKCVSSPDDVCVREFIPGETFEQEVDNFTEDDREYGAPADDRNESLRPKEPKRHRKKNSKHCTNNKRNGRRKP